MVSGQASHGPEHSPANHARTAIKTYNRIDWKPDFRYRNELGSRNGSARASSPLPPASPAAAAARALRLAERSPLARQITAAITGLQAILSG